MLIVMASIEMDEEIRSTQLFVVWLNALQALNFKFSIVNFFKDLKAGYR